MRYKPALKNFSTAILETQEIKKFKQIPGPLRLPFIGSSFYYKLGLYDIYSYHDVLRTMHKNYGPLVREDIGTHSIIHVFEPDDVQTVYNAEGKNPYVPPLQETTQIYRRTKNMSLGLGNTNGEEWYRLRSAVQKMMLRPKEVHYYLPLVDKVAKSFVEKVKSSLTKDLIAPDLRILVAKWSLESSAMVCFETKFGAFDTNEKLAEQMIQANKDIFVHGGILKHSLPFYKFMWTPRWAKFQKAEDFFYTHATKLVEQTIETISQLANSNQLTEGQYNFISYLLSRKELTRKDVIVITLSLFADGLSTTTPTLLFNLYCLAKHPEVQEEIYNEVSQAFESSPQPTTMTVDIINSLQLLKAAVKETFRLYPNGTEVSRLIQTDLVLSNYEVPAGTHVDLNPFVQFRSSKYFYKPDEYIPQRWIRDGRNSDVGNKLSTHPYLLTPFGHGTRMCAGRRFAEQDLYTVISRLIYTFKIRLVDENEDMEQTYNTLLFPKNPLRIRFIER